ncbi:MAG: DAK2 domain-containing protein [Tissierellia bacterium]|nr:DAK2 domain-containing protein [Tissierellia bacterium]
MEKINSKQIKAGIVAAYQNLDSNKELVNSLNVFPVPDGDTGTNMSLTMKSVFNKMQSVDDDNLKSIAKALGSGSLMGARGNSGVILSQLCRGVTLVLEKSEYLGVEELAQAALKAKETAYKAVLKPTEGTILTVSRKMAEFAIDNKDKYTDVVEFLNDIIVEGNLALESTPDLLPVLKQAGVVDAGGKGLMVLLEGFYASVAGKELVEYAFDKTDIVDFDNFEDLHDFESPEDIVYGYCTEFFINHDGSQNYEDWREFISQYGDSIVCVGDDEMIKTHIHTNNPGKLLEFAMQRGSLSGIKIDNMRLQFAERNEKKEKSKALKESQKKDYGFVAISIGKGFDDVFTDLGVDQIISGGQTMNPSTEDIVEACKKINASTVFIFPNNKNIILAAKQAVELVEDKEVMVIETKSIPQAYTALFNFDESLDKEENFENMSSSIDEVKTLELTYAVRDTQVGDLTISKGDIIGISEKDIVSKGHDVNETMLDLIKKSIDDFSGLVTIYYGEEIEEDQAQKLLDLLEIQLPDLDYELVMGGQPLYYYIASVE